MICRPRMEALGPLGTLAGKKEMLAGFGCSPKQWAALITSLLVILVPEHPPKLPTDFKCVCEPASMAPVSRTRSSVPMIDCPSAPTIQLAIRSASTPDHNQGFRDILPSCVQTTVDPLPSSSPWPLSSPSSRHCRRPHHRQA